MQAMVSSMGVPHPIVPVHEIAVDVVGLEPLQAGINGLEHIFPARVLDSALVAVVGVHKFAAKFGDQKYLVPISALKGLAQDLFRTTGSIDRGGVHNVYAAVNHGVHRCHGVFLGDGTELLSTQRPGAQT